MNKKNISQKEFLFNYYKNHPNKDIEHKEIVTIVIAEWEKKYGTTLADPDRAIRTLFEEGKLIKVKKGVYKYDPSFVAISQAKKSPSNRNRKKNVY